MNTKKHSWSSIAWLTCSALLVMVLTDIGLRWLTPIVHLREVEDAISEYKTSDPTVLVVGSSHARTFDTTGKEVFAYTKGQQRLLTVPVEFGKFHSYYWVLQHRLRRWIEEEDPHGNLKRPSLHHVILVTEWWDSTPTEQGGPAHNLPARAWTWQHFLQDVAQHGITSYNSNYLRYRWERIFSFSTLVQDRGHHRIVATLRNKLRPIPSHIKHREFQEKIRAWRNMILHGAKKMVHPGQMKALQDFVTYFRQRQIKVTILLYPRMPITLTQEARHRTLDAFALLMKHFCKEHDVDLIDASYQSPVSDHHFSTDLDHMTEEGNTQWTQWALKAPLLFLLHPPPPRPKTPYLVDLPKLLPLSGKRSTP